MASASYKAAVALLAAKAVGFFREGALLLLAMTKPDAVNIYFVASQCGMGLRENNFVRAYFAVIAIIALVSGDMVRGILFLAIVLPFLLWPGVLARIESRFGLWGIIGLTTAFNVLSVFEIVGLQQFPLTADSPYIGAPVITLWLVVISSAAIFGVNKVAQYNRVLVSFIMLIVLVRMALLTGLINVEGNGNIFIAIRFVELTVPQFANFQRVFRKI